MATYKVMKADGSLDENHELAEWFFIINYFIRSIVFAVGRGIPYELGQIQEMQKNVLELFPDFMKNKSLLSREIYREPLKLIDIPVVQLQGIQRSLGGDRKDLPQRDLTHEEDQYHHPRIQHIPLYQPLCTFSGEAESGSRCSGDHTYK